ncbi:VWA domain-containing protein [Dyella sp.]|jgi:Ca-activated chloride channel family protein|uniref:vWA domain-containing protein n=1 Tax=Dyella sp. TaxID=1869338 RepID=UPI002D785FA6|nr:VWA domain-containing protein [Dyella sp.]HET6431031.1 VWA domain-containing protein [Dyella sp.]
MSAKPLLLRVLPVALALALSVCGTSRPMGDTAATPTPSAAAATKPRAATGAHTAGHSAPPPAAVPAPPAPPSVPVAAAPLAEARRAEAKLAETADASRRMAYAPTLMAVPQLVAPAPWSGSHAVNTEHYTHRDSNPVQLASEQPVSTFGLDVDTGSYTNVRRMLEAGQLPPADAVRAEEFINYFDYGYTPPADQSQPFSVTTELAPAPWNPQRQLLLVGVQGYRVPASAIPAANLVFLIDTSGSMDEPDKLPLLKASLKQLVGKLREQDRVAIVTYAGSAGVALPSTAGDRHATIDAAIDSLGANGSTNGDAGIDLAYAQAEQGFITGGVNRVILATDGDFNVGTVSEQALKTKIEDHRKSGVALTTLGFGEGNYNDAMAVMLADAGNGSHHYIDSLQEGRRVLVDELSATLLTIAKDVKVQVEFNPAQVKEYRLIGYEKRQLRREDFNNDAVDAGDIGAGANVTAIYEITPAGSDATRVDPLRYGKHDARSDRSGELAFLRLRYKLPGHDASTLIERPIAATPEREASARLRFAASVAAFAEALRGGRYLDGYDYARISALARDARGDDADGYRAGFVQLVNLADGLSTHGAGAGKPTLDAGPMPTAPGIGLR